MTQGSKVLIVDDEAAVRTLLRRWITGWGYGVREAATAHEALAILETDPAHVVLCDISMPEHDGVWLAGQVHARWPGIAIIMSTAHDDAETVRASRHAGARAYVIKPFNPIMVREALEDAAAASPASGA